MEGETIDPPCGTGACFTGGSICACASIPAYAAPSYTGVMIGWNVQQDSLGNEGTWTATGTGLTVNWTATGATGQTRVLVQTAAGDYCANATSGMTVPWANFKLQCYNEVPGASFTPGSQVKAIAVQINGDDSAAQSVTDFCITGATVN
jgi:hypothetical protein